MTRQSRAYIKARIHEALQAAHKRQDPPASAEWDEIKQRPGYAHLEADPVWHECLAGLGRLIRAGRSEEDSEYQELLRRISALRLHYGCHPKANPGESPETFIKWLDQQYTTARLCEAAYGEHLDRWAKVYYQALEWQDRLVHDHPALPWPGYSIGSRIEYQMSPMAALANLARMRSWAVAAIPYVQETPGRPEFCST